MIDDAIERLRAAHADPEGHDGLTWDPLTAELVGSALAKIDRLQIQIDRLREEHKDPVLVAEDLFESMMLDLANGEPRYLDEEDDPEVLRECLRRQRLAAAAERLSHEARAFVAKVLVDPADPLAGHIVVTTPTGDRAHERALAADVIRLAVANALLSGFWQGFIRGVIDLAAKTSAGEVTPVDAWARVVDLIGDEGRSTYEPTKVTCKACVAQIVRAHRKESRG